MLSPRHCPSPSGLKRAALASAALALALSACSTDRPLFAALSTTASISTEGLTPADAEKQVTYWGDRYQVNEKNRDVALNYASVLRQTGRVDQAVAVLQKAVINFPEDRAVL